jgi:hypothetical protein
MVCSYGIIKYVGVDSVCSFGSVVETASAAGKRVSGLTGMLDTFGTDP